MSDEEYLRAAGWAWRGRHLTMDVADNWCDPIVVPWSDGVERRTTWPQGHALIIQRGRDVAATSERARIVARLRERATTIEDQIPLAPPITLTTRTIAEVHAQFLRDAADMIEREGSSK